MDFDRSYGYDEIGYPTVASPDYSDIEKEAYNNKRKYISRNHEGFSPFPKNYRGRANVNYSLDNSMRNDSAIVKALNTLTSKLDQKDNMTVANKGGKMEIVLDEKTIFYLIVFLVIMVVVQHFQIKKLNKSISSLAAGEKLSS